MTDAAPIAAEKLPSLIARRAANRDRFLVGIIGPPGAGKSTLAENVAAALNTAAPGAAIVVPMDGFHYDDAVLVKRGLHSRKGAPETFDVGGFAALLDRLSTASDEITIPLFDRALEVSRAGAAIVSPSHRILIVEGNYLLLDEPPWSALAGYFDLTIGIEVPLDILETRLLRRCRENGRDADAARAWVNSNDMPNARRVISHSSPPDFIVPHSRTP